jgi:hypothetical protein
VSECARYQVRTPMWLWLTNGAMTAFCVLVVGAIAIVGDVPGTLLLLASVLVGTTFGFWLTMSAYRVGGGRNLIRFYPDRVEVPSIKDRKPMVFPRDGTQIHVTDVIVRYRLGIAATIASVNRGKLVELTHGGRSRKFSTLILDETIDERFLVADLQRFASGEPALGRAGHTALADTRSVYDDRLDRELAQLD